MTRLSRRAFTLGTAATLMGTALSTKSRAQGATKIRVGSLTLPVFAPIIVNIMKAQKFDTKNGFEAEVQVYPSFAAYYAGLATGEIDTLIGGPPISRSSASKACRCRLSQRAPRSPTSS